LALHLSILKSVGMVYQPLDQFKRVCSTGSSETNLSASSELQFVRAASLFEENL